MKKLIACSTFLLAIAVAPLSFGATDAERIEALEQQLLQALEEIRQLKARLPDEEGADVTAKMAESVVDSTDAQSGTATAAGPAETSIELYGHMQLDMIYDFDRVDPDWESTLRPSTIPIEDGQFGSDGNTVLSVKQTQLGFRAESETPLGRVKTWFEFDFFGTGSDAGDTKFNLRHAWVELGGLGFGQTNSTFMDISIFPNVVDWWGPSGMAFNRNPQLRYTWLRDNGQVAVALEKPNGSFNSGIFGEISPGFGDAATDKTQYPDLTAHWRQTFDWGHYQVAGVLRQLEFETRGTPNNKPDGDDIGWGLNITGVINTFGRDQLKMGLVYGEGIASFMNDGGVNLAPDNFEAKAVEVTGLTIYYDHYWSDEWSSSIGYSMHDNDPLGQMAANEFQTGQYASTNILYNPYPELLIGSELL